MRDAVCRTLAIVISLVTAGPSAATPPFEGCFVRVYDTAHQAAHKGQTVMAVKLRLAPRQMDDGLTVSAVMRFDFRGRDGAFYAVGACKADAAGATCGLDQDAGKISLKPGAGGLTLSVLQDVRADAASGDEGDSMTVEYSNAEDRTFALSMAPAEACKEFEDDDAAGEIAPE